MKITRQPVYHQLDPGYGGYMSVHLGSGSEFTVLTTPVSTLSIAEHRMLLSGKILEFTENFTSKNDNNDQSKIK